MEEPTVWSQSAANLQGNVRLCATLTHQRGFTSHISGHIYVHIRWKEFRYEYLTGTNCQWSAVLLVAALFWSWSIWGIFILYPLTWISKNPIFYVTLAHWRWNMQMFAPFLLFSSTSDYLPHPRSAAAAASLSLHIFWDLTLTLCNGFFTNKTVLFIFQLILNVCHGFTCHRLHTTYFC